MASERGTVMVMVAVWLPILALFVSFAVDVAHFFDYSRNLQNRADAAALAAGDQYGGICFGSPSASDMAPIGQMAQLFSGPPGNQSDLLYPYSGAGSPLTAFPQYPWAASYQNTPNLSVSNGTSGQNFHVFLNADNYSADGGTQLAIGDYCHGNPTLDHQDKECYGQTSLSGQLAVDCATAPMIDVKLTQTNLPLFFPLTSIAPNISAHARVTLHALASTSQLLPLGVGDAAYVPCVKVKFISDDGSVSPTTLQLQLNQALTKSMRNPVWDNTTDNGGAGDAVAMPATAGHYDYMQAMLYSQDPTTGTCGGTPRNSITYPLSSTGSSTTDGLLAAETAPSASLGTLANDAVPRIDAGGIVLTGGGNPDQYFSSNGNYSVTVTANVAFSGNSGTKQVWAVDTNTGQMNQLTRQGATNTWSGSMPTTGTLSDQSGQHPICIQVSQTGGLLNSQASKCPTVSGSPGGGATYYSLGIQHETFAACNEATSACSNDESGPIIQAQIGNVTVGGGGVPVVDWSKRVFTPNSSPNLMVQLELQGLSAANRYNPATGTGDLCANGQCTVLRLDNAGNGNGAIDCGEGNGASAIEAVILSTCPSYSNPPSGLCTNNSSGYCGDWTTSSDGTCNNTGSTRPAGGGPVDCVNTNNGGANLPTCIAARIQTGGSVNQTNCNVTGAQGCAVDHWLQGDAIPLGDPRVFSAFVVFSGDIINANGNTPVPIRQFAAFYVTGWKFQGGGQVNCPPGVNPSQANEPPPASAASAKNAVWGHWITYTVPGKGDPQQICDFQAIGECTPVLTR